MENAHAYMTTAEVATLWRVTERTVVNWINDGLLPAKRAGRHWRIKREDADQGPAERAAEAPGA